MNITIADLVKLSVYIVGLLILVGLGVIQFPVTGGMVGNASFDGLMMLLVVVSVAVMESMLHSHFSDHIDPKPTRFRVMTIFSAYVKPLIAYALVSFLGIAGTLFLLSFGFFSIVNWVLGLELILAFVGFKTLLRAPFWCYTAKERFFPQWLGPSQY